ncbi:type II secretory pathway pseudopilin PulG [Deinococcus metalli]|uniref:Type II secretory pathway pseudopilin PulG n=1 Tax=Deinococcus metalli TaxID=1141878 RepID=A0A7W8KHM1_9DEIO|nr:hypothetical protein [Deinococcus metalli]MBB5378327.1 type II secretory pathway pseudopilin PulG [Deinococcus metalli]GHF59683.1 hypothetical protein GCM10017781_40040 [Deinococcus metalli]
MSVRALLPLLLMPALGACQDTQARVQNEALTRRVAALEAQVQVLKAAQARASTPDGLEAQLSAQNCANDLTRALETYRENSIDGRYPTPAELDLPDTCTGQRVNWQALTAHAYTFSISGDGGRELARQSGP